MKAPLFSFFLLTSFFALTQGLSSERAFQTDYDQTVTGLICQNGFNYSVQEVDLQSTFFTKSFLQKRTSAGDLVWEIEVMEGFGERTLVDHMSGSPNGDILLTGVVLTTCDVVGDCVAFALRYDENGLLIWSKIVTDTLCDASFSLSGFSSFMNNHSLICSDSPQGTSIVEFDEIGLEVYSRPAPVAGILKFVADSDSIIYGYHDQTIYRFSLNGGSDVSQTLSTTVRDIGIRNDSLFVLTYNSLLIYSGDLQSELLNIPAGVSNCRNLKVSDSAIRFGANNGISTTVSTFDPNTQTISNVQFTESTEIAVEYDFDADLTVLETYPMAEYNSIRWRNFVFSGASQNFERPDIGVVAIAISEAWVEPIPNAPSNVVTLHYKPKVLVKNWGNVPLNNAFLNVPIDIGICNMIYYNTEYSFSLAAGDSVWQELDWFSAVKYFPDNNVYLNLCAFTSNPNNLVDLNTLNDRTCQLFQLGTLGVNGIQPNAQIPVYPNPSNGKFWLQIPENSTVEYEIFNSLGKQIIAGVYSGVLDLSQYNPGVYIIRLQNEKGASTIQKIIVE